MVNPGRHRQRVIRFALTALLVLGAAQGRAVAAETTTIHLRNGIIYSGEIVEWVPGDHVTLRLVTGEVRRVAWADLVVPAPAPEVPQPAAPLPSPLDVGPLPPPGTAPLPPGATAPGTLVTIRANQPVIRLSEITGGAGAYLYSRRGSFITFESWRSVCLAPCNQLVRSDALYRVNGPGIVTSRPFTLPPGSVTLDVKAGRLGGLFGGTFMAAYGGIAFLLGPTLLGLSVTFSDSPFERNPLRIAGTVLLIGGAGLVAGGIALAVRSRTRVKVLPTTPGLGPGALSFPLRSGRTLALSAAGLHF